MTTWALGFGTTALAKQNAQTRSDAIHQWMIAHSLPYAQSVLVGQTTCWNNPYNTSSNPAYFVAVKDRCFGALTSTEIASLTTISPTAI